MVLEHAKKMLKLLQRRKLLFLKNSLCGDKTKNGVSIFDIYLPPDYPQVPPMVTFLTTGCGSMLFNTNLYANGNVSLSFLGTWSGPGWQPEKSILLQVIVSIHSLIICNGIDDRVCVGRHASRINNYMFVSALRNPSYEALYQQFIHFNPIQTC